MKNWYFYQERGKTVGPVSIEDMKTRIREGRIQLFDMIHHEGADGWKMAMEFPELRAEFKASKLQTLGDRPWVVLQRRSEKALDFGTSGPFSTEEIRKSINAGVIAYSDYAWKEGFSEWKRLGTIEEFNRRMQERAEEKKATEALPPLPDMPAREVLKNVVELKRPTVKTDLPPPPEASGRNLAEKDALKDKEIADARASLKSKEERRQKEEARRKEESRLKAELAGTPPIPALEVEPAKNPALEATVITPRISSRGSSEDPDEDEEFAQSEEVTATNAKPLKKKSRRVVDWGIVVFLILVLGGVTFGVSRYLESPPPMASEPPPEAPEPVAKAAPPEPKPKPVVEPPKPQAKVADSKPILPPPKPEPPKVPDTPPTELYLNVQTASSTQVKIEIRSDGGPSYPIFVQIVGLPGQVAEGASFYRYLKFTPTGDPKQPIDLSDVKLPQGKFIMRAHSGNLSKEARMNIGTGETAFKQAAGRLRKTYSASILRERLALFKLAQTLETQITEAAGGKPFSAKGLSALNGVKRSTGANYILFEQWFELKEIMDAAKTGASAALLVRAKQARERISTFSVWK